MLRKQATIAFWIGLGVFGLVGLVAYRTTSEVAETGTAVEHGQEIVDALAAERVALADAAAMQRAHGLTGDPAFVDGYGDAVSRVTANGHLLHQLTSDNPRQARQWDSLEPTIQKRITMFDSAVDRREAGALNAELEAKDVTAGRLVDSEILPIISELESDERSRLSHRRQLTSQSVAQIRIFIVLGTSVGGLLLLLTFLKLRTEVARRLRSEKSARESEESLATTLMSIGDGVISTDLEGRVVRMNRVAEELTGWTGASAVGKPAVEVFHVIQEGSRNPIPNPVLATVRAGVPITLLEQALLIQRGGNEVPVAHSCAPVRDAHHQLRGAVLVFRDVTEAQRAKKLQDAAQRQMIFADRMVAVGTLAAGVAHEINNPLTYVTANLEFIIEELRNPPGSSPGSAAEIRQMATEALQGANRVKKIVKGLKTFSRVEEAQRAVMDLHSVLELAIKMTFNEIRQRARLVRSYGSCPLVEGDEGRLGQVFVNLLVNAAQATPEGKASGHEIRVATSTDPSGGAIVEVHDTGGGIPASALARIFEPFFTTKPIGAGTGLGLSICHNIVKDMGGEITVTSEVGVGTTFRITLPASASSRASSALRVNPAPSESANGGQILILDDEPQVAGVLARMLREHHVTVVNEASEALKLLARGNHFDVIFSDLMMPQMSGMDFYDELAHHHPNAVDSVVFLTGGAFTPAAQAFLDRVPNQRLAKPFDPESIDAIVATLIPDVGRARDYPRN
jgi:PAS domain S-box-containing protein